MSRTASFTARALAAAMGLACSLAFGAEPADDPISSASSAQLRAAYLECARLSEEARLGASMMLTCKSVADVLMHRDFGGDLDRQLAWWREARAEHAASVVGSSQRP